MKFELSVAKFGVLKFCVAVVACLLATLSGYSQTLGVDTITSSFSKVDQFQSNLKAIDSIQSNFYKRTDSLKSIQEGLVGKLDSVTTRLRNRFDSLSTLRVSTLTTTHLLDSMNQLRERTMIDFDRRLQSIKDQTTGRLKALNLPRELNEKISSITGSVEGFKLPASFSNISSLNLPSNPLQNLDGVDLKASIPLVENPIGEINTSALSSPAELKDIALKSPEMTGVTDQVSSYGKDAQELAKGNLNGLNSLSETAEEEAVELSGVEDITDQTKVLEEYKGVVEQVNDPEALKQQAVQKVQQAAINHFAGKEEQIQQAMEVISKYKKQYASAIDVSKLPKKRPNEMKGKSLIERLVPGIAVQIQKEGENLLVDFNPYVGYRITGRITAGLGWNQRLAYNTKQSRFDSNASIYGPRIFGEYNLWKGFCPRVELEITNCLVTPFPTTASVDQANRQWVWGAFIGLKKDYRFLGRVRGTAMIMTRLFDPHHKSPYADVINARFGFEFPMKKKSKPVASN